MAISSLPTSITTNYDVYEYKHAVAILINDFPNEYRDLINVLSSFTLKRSQILTPGGRKSPIANYFDSYLYGIGWQEHKFDTAIEIDQIRHESPTHKVDCYKNRVAFVGSPYFSASVS